jgi:hypothetical protein
MPPSLLFPDGLWKRYNNLGDSFTNPSLFSSLLTTREDATSSTHMIPLLGDPDLSIYLDAMNFIPSLEVAATGKEKLQALNRLPSRAALLLPFLTACYTKHGGRQCWPSNASSKIV